MTTKFIWDELKKLVIIDHHINRLKKEISKEESTLAEAKAPLSPVAKRVSELTATIREAKKKIDHLEISLGDLRAKDVKKKAVLETLTQPKEYHALERELAEIERLIVGLENQELKLMEQQEEAQKEVHLQEAELARIEETISEQTKQSQVKIQELESEIAAQEKAWNDQVNHVPSDLSRGYTEIRQRVTNPVVPIVSQSCSACFYGLLYQDTIALGSQTIIRCRGCYRYLFTPDSSTEQLAS